MNASRGAVDAGVERGRKPRPVDFRRLGAQEGDDVILEDGLWAETGDVDKTVRNRKAISAEVGDSVWTGWLSDEEHSRQVDAFGHVELLLLPEGVVSEVLV